jgi:Ricin-type beta-trefoil lectin domain-like
MAGDYIFFGEIINKNITWVYRKADGVFVGKMQPPANYINQAGWGLDTPYGITAYKRSNGEYIVISEEDLFNKNIVFRWCASGACNAVLATDDLVANGIYELAPLHANNMRLQINANTVQIGNANGAIAQKWKLLPAANGYGLAPLSTPKQRLNIQGVCNANAAAVDVAENNNALAQQWKLIRISNGVYELAPDKRLEVTGSGVVAGTNVQLWQTTNSNNQRWVLKLAGSNAPAATAVNIFPNPVRGNSFTLNIKNNSRSKITVVLTGINGVKYNCKCTQIIAGSYTVVCDKILPPGSYIVTAINGDEVYTQKIIVAL